MGLVTSNCYGSEVGLITSSEIAHVHICSCTEVLYFMILHHIIKT